MRLHVGSDQVTPVRWFKSRPGVKPFNRATPFGSLQWRAEPWRPFPLGEIYGAARPFEPGHSPAFADGERLCGDESWFRFGEPLDPSKPPMLYTPDGLATCCLLPRPQVVDGRVVASGTVTAQSGYFDIGVANALAFGSVRAVGTHGCELYSLSTIAPPNDIFHRESDSVDRWVSSFAPLFRMEGPNVTGVDALWRCINTSGGGCIWERSGWDGFGAGVFTLTAGSCVTPITMTCVD